jgi:hypothetical protein
LELVSAACGLAVAIAAVTASCTGARGPRADGVGELRMAVSAGGLAAGVTAIRYRVVAAGQGCDAAPLAEFTISLVAGTAGDAGASDAGVLSADGFAVLAPGTYHVCATPMAGASPATGCATAESDAVVVAEGTTEIALVARCGGAPSGGLGVVTALDDPPRIDGLTIQPSAFITPCDTATITVSASDPNGDPLAYAWAVVSSPPGSQAMLNPMGAAATFSGDLAGSYGLSVTVSDPRGATASLTFPIHVTSQGCGAGGSEGAVADAGATGDAGGSGGSGGAGGAAGDPSLLLHYTFDGDIANTGSLPGFDATTVGTTSFVPGKFGLALQIGDRGVAEVFGMKSVLGVFPQYTISFWAKASSPPPAGSNLFFDGNFGTAPFGGVALAQADPSSLLLCAATASNRSLGGACNGPPAPALSAWHNIILRYLGAGTGFGQGGAVELYIDGALAYTLPNDSAADPVFNANIPDFLQIGSIPYLIDDLRVYNRTFSPAAQCTTVIGGTLGDSGSCTLPESQHLLLHYTFDGSGVNTGALPGFDVALPGDATFVDGLFGQAVQFSPLDFDEVAHIDGVRAVLDESPQYTISFWVETSSLQTGSTFLNLFGAGGGVELIQLAQDTSQILCVGTSSNQLLGGQCHRIPAPPLGGWHNVIVRYHGAGTGPGQGGPLQVFIDGAPAFTQINDAANDPVFSPSIPDVLRMGPSPNPIDDLKVYDRVFGLAEQCTTVIGGTLTPPCTCVLPGATAGASEGGDVVCGSGDVDFGNIEGTATWHTGQNGGGPLPGIAVLAASFRSSLELVDGTTDDGGGFTMSNLGSGLWGVSLQNLPAGCVNPGPTPVIVNRGRTSLVSFDVDCTQASWRDVTGVVVATGGDGLSFGVNLDAATGQHIGIFPGPDLPIRYDAGIGCGFGGGCPVGLWTVSLALPDGCTYPGPVTVLLGPDQTQTVNFFPTCQ